MSALLHDRARRIRERALVRAWEYRQCNYARGVWHRLRRLLVDAAEAWIIDESEATRLESEGQPLDPVGQEMAPPKRVFTVDRAALEGIHGRRQIPVRMSVELLQARSIVLVRFAATRRS